jgi:AraC-like DNA-binding protein
MSTLIRAEDLPRAERFEALHEMVAQLFVPMELRSGQEADYLGQFRSSGAGPMHVTVMDMMPITVARTPRLIRRADPELLKLVMPLRSGGSYVVSQGGRQARLAPGEFALYETRLPYEVVCGVGGQAASAMTFMFPRSALPLPPSQLKQLTAVRMPASAGVGALASQVLVQLARNIDDCTPTEAVRLSTCALEILATRLSHELDAAGWVRPETHRRALVTSVQAFVEQHLGDPALTPAAIAAAHHVSLRYLHKLFHEHGVTVAGWIRRRRLERCRRDLADPEMAAHPVAAIAARWGFSTATYFGQVFRAAHGMTPAEYRRSTLRTPMMPTAETTTETTTAIVHPIDTTVR